MRKKILIVTAFLALGAVFFSFLHFSTGNGAALSIAITFGTAFYHFAVRLLTGFIINARLGNNIDYTKPWFEEKSFEKRLYEMLKVKSLKKHMPAFEPIFFDMKKRTVKEIIMAGCQAEIVHEIILLLSFVPLLFTVWFGSFGVFFVTSLLAAAFDSIFVIIQRYNRPRLVKLAERQAKDGTVHAV